MALADASAWLVSTPVSALMRSSLWLYPIIEIFHILGFVVLVGGVSLFDLRVLGFARTLPVDTLGRYLLPWSVAAWNVGATAPPAARLQAFVSLLLWVAIISCGRLLAYL